MPARQSYQRAESPGIFVRPVSTRLAPPPPAALPTVSEAPQVGTPLAARRNLPGNLPVQTTTPRSTLSGKLHSARVPPFHTRQLPGPPPATTSLTAASQMKSTSMLESRSPAEGGAWAQVFTRTLSNA